MAVQFTALKNSYPKRARNLKVRNTGSTLRNVSFKVARLTNNNYLLNADGAPSQVGSRLSVSNNALPGGNQLWDKNELLTQNFRIGLLSRNAFVLQLDVYAIVVKAAAADADQEGGVKTEELVGSVTIEVDSETALHPGYPTGPKRWPSAISST
jgi:hypothetical protein